MVDPVSHPTAPRRTRQRTAVDGILADRDDFRTAQEIYEELRRFGERVGLTTVYRTLQAMTEAGELDALRTAEGETAHFFFKRLIR